MRPFQEAKGILNLSDELRLRTYRVKIFEVPSKHGWAVVLGSAERHALKVAQSHCELVDNAAMVLSAQTLKRSKR